MNRQPEQVEQQQAARRTRRDWTEEDISTLKMLCKEGCPGSEIAARLGRTTQAVYTRMYMLGIHQSPQMAMWARAFAQPHSLHELAAQWGISTTALQQRKHRVRAAGYPVVRATRNPQQAR